MSMDIRINVIYGFEVQNHYLGGVSYSFQTKCEHTPRTPQDRYCATCGRENRPRGLLELGHNVAQVLQVRNSRISPIAVKLPVAELPGKPFFGDVNAAVPIGCWRSPGDYNLPHNSVVFGTEIVHQNVDFSQCIALADIAPSQAQIDTVESFYKALVAASEADGLEWPRLTTTPKLLLHYQATY